MEPPRHTGARPLIDYLLGLCALFFLLFLVYPFARMVWPRAHLPLEGTGRVLVCSSSELGDQRAMPFIYRGDPYLAVKSGEAFYALSALCTYRDTLLDWDEERRVLICPAHGCTYDLRGNVLSGLPSRPLESMEVRVSAGRVFAGRPR